jgi:hypothetical protein
MMGIVGLPNVGKSTLFTALTKKQVEVANYPFATIDPNVGVVAVPDERLDVLAKLSRSKEVIPTTIEFRDIAGLVKDAHKGEGLGNKFLSHIREVDAIVHVVRHFSDGNVTHVSGKVDPKEDAETISAELALADLEAATKALNKLRDKAKGGLEKDEKKLLSVLERTEQHLGSGRPVRELALEEDEEKLVRPLQLLTMKPQLTVANVDEAMLQQGIDVPGALTLNAKLEAEIAALPSEEAKTYLAEYHLARSGLERLIVASYELLKLLTFFTTGEKETRAWTAPQGTKAPQAAGRIHTDFEEGFIRAEVIGYDDFVSAGGELAAREAGKLRMEGNDYVVQDGDIVHFHFQR